MHKYIFLVISFVLSGSLTATLPTEETAEKSQSRGSSASLHPVQHPSDSNPNTPAIFCVNLSNGLITYGRAAVEHKKRAAEEFVKTFGELLEQPERSALSQLPYAHSNCLELTYPTKPDFLAKKIGFDPDGVVYRASAKHKPYNPAFFESNELRTAPWAQSANAAEAEENGQLGGTQKSIYLTDLTPDERPLNPFGKTGMTGRGVLGHWGANRAVDALVTRLNPYTEQLEVLLVYRKHDKMFAVPGGMQEEDAFFNALNKELAEEVGAELAKVIQKKFKAEAKPVYTGYMDDPRNTDNAWMETHALWYHMSEEEAAASFKMTYAPTDTEEVEAKYGGFAPLKALLTQDEDSVRFFNYSQAAVCPFTPKAVVPKKLFYASHAHLLNCMLREDLFKELLSGILHLALPTTEGLKKEIQAVKASPIIFKES